MSNAEVHYPRFASVQSVFASACPGNTLDADRLSGRGCSLLASEPTSLALHALPRWVQIQYPPPIRAASNAFKQG
jgi:hypothetical protein